MAKRQLSWIEAIEKVLEDEKKPAMYTEIADLIVERSYRKDIGATPANTVSAYLHRDIKENENSIFFKVQRGTFTLKKYLNQIEEDDEINTETEDEKNKHRNVIRAFGISWNRESVIWKTNPDLWGIQTIDAKPVNFGKQIGIYLLYDGREVTYVGKAFDQSLAQRLSQHTKDRHSGRWNRFSWFGLFSVNEKGKLETLKEGYREITHKKLVETLEAILIESIEPRQNRRSGDNFTGIEYNQFNDPEIERKLKTNWLEELKNKL